MNSVLQFLTFLFFLSIPAIAIFAELSRKTPNSIIYSSIRSVICVASLLVCAFVLTPTYQANALHFMGGLIFFLVSCVQLYMETNSISYHSIINFGNESNKRF